MPRKQTANNDEPDCEEHLVELKPWDRVPRAVVSVKNLETGKTVKKCGSCLELDGDALAKQVGIIPADS